MNKLIDSKKIMQESRVALSKAVCERLHVSVGDFLVFVEDPDGKIFLKKAEAPA